MSGAAIKSVPGFRLVGSGQPSRLGANRAKFNANEAGSESSSRVLSARSQDTKESVINADDNDNDNDEEEVIEKTWLENQKVEEARLAAIEEQQNKIFTRKLNLKNSKYKVEIQQAVKVVNDLVESTKKSLDECSIDDIINLGIGLKEEEEGVQRKKNRKDVRPEITSIPEEGLIGTIRHLSAVTSKIITRNNRLEDIIKNLKKEYTTEKKKFEVNIQNIKLQMSELRIAKENAEFTIKDQRIIYEAKLKKLNQEYEDAKHSLQILEVVNNNLKNTVYEQEGEIFNIPRLEETYLRKARSIVLTKERELQDKNIQLKQIEKDAEQSEYWHGRASAYQEELKLKDLRIIEVNKQLTIISNKYRSLIRKYDFMMDKDNEYIRLEQREEIFEESEKYDDDKKNEYIKRKRKNQIRSRSPSPIQSGLCGSGSPISSPGRPHTAEIILPSRKPLAKLGGRRMSSLEMAQQGKNPMEIEVTRLKEANEMLQRKLDRANRSLAASRAYPLLNSGKPPPKIEGENSEGQGQGQGHGHEGNEEKKKLKLNQQEELDLLFESDEDKEERDFDQDEMIKFEQKQRQLTAKRIERAVGVSTAYKAKLKQLRETRPGVKHLKGLREKHETEDISKDPLF